MRVLQKKCTPRWMSVRLMFLCVLWPESTDVSFGQPVLPILSLKHKSPPLPGLQVHVVPLDEDDDNVGEDEEVLDHDVG